MARNTVLRYLKTPDAMRPKARPLRGSKLDQYTGHIDRRMSEGLENCVVLHRELRTLGYDGGYSILKSYVSPRRRRWQPDATMRFETAPGEQAQVDWGSMAYLDKAGQGWKETSHLGVRDDPGLVKSLLRGTGQTGGHRRLHPVPCECLRVPGRRAPALSLRQCQGGDPGTGRGRPGGVEPPDAGLRPAGGLRDQVVPAIPGPDQGQGRKRGAVRQGQHVAQHAFHRRRRPQPPGTGVVRQRCQPSDSRYYPPGALGDAGRGTAALGETSGPGHVAPYLREDRKVARDGFVSWKGSRYGVHWKWVGRIVQVGQRLGTVEVWAGDERIAVHPRSQKPGQRLILPGQWQGLPRGDGRPKPEAMAVQIPAGEVERRSLGVYELAAVGGA